MSATNVLSCLGAHAGIPSRTMLRRAEALEAVGRDSGRGDGQAEGEPGPLARLGLGPGLAAVEVDDLLAQVEAEAAGALVARVFGLCRRENLLNSRCRWRKWVSGGLFGYAHNRMKARSEHAASCTQRAPLTDPSRDCIPVRLTRLRAFRHVGGDLKAGLAALATIVGRVREAVAQHDPQELGVGIGNQALATVGRQGDLARLEERLGLGGC